MKTGHTDCHSIFNPTQLSAYQNCKTQLIKSCVWCCFCGYSMQTLHACMFSAQFWELTRIPRESSPRQVRAKFWKVKQFRMQKKCVATQVSRKKVFIMKEKRFYTGVLKMSVCNWCIVLVTLSRVMHWRGIFVQSGGQKKSDIYAAVKGRWAIIQ